MIYILPIEPLEERYSEQWYRWFPDRLKELGFNENLDFMVVDGEPLNETVEVGTFLDVNSTLHYKSTQLQFIAELFHQKRVKDGDVFFVADVEFWGIEAIRYLAKVQNIKIRMCGFCHAGSYTREDFFAPCADFAHHYETAWGSIFDVIFVGSQYHKDRLVSQRGIPSEKISVSGNPYRLDAGARILRQEIKDTQWSHLKRKKQFVLTNRPDEEKRPFQSLYALLQLKEKHPDVSIVLTTSRETWGKQGSPLRTFALMCQNKKLLAIREGISKEEYFEILSESVAMVSNSIEENYGYCIHEALLFRCFPICRRDFSHPELVPSSDFLFNSPKEQHDAMERVFLESAGSSVALQALEIASHCIVKKGEDSLNHILQEMLS